MNGKLHPIFKKTQPVMMRKRKMTSGRPQQNSFIVITVYRESNCTFPLPMKYIDVTRTTHTSLDVLMEKLIEDYWNVDGERELSDAWTSFTRFILLNERPPDGCTWSGGRLTRKKRPLAQTMYGQICGRICPMQQRRKQNKDGLSRNQNSTMPDI